MSTIICYMTSNGCTEKVSGLLKSKLAGEVKLANLKHEPEPDLESFSTIIIGGSIHAGRIQKKISSFCQQKEQMLLQKRIGLFICCMEEGEKAQAEFEQAYPESLRQSAAAIGCLGGEFNFERMNLIQRIIVRKVAKVSQTVSRLNQSAIDAFIEKINSSEITE